MAEFRHRKNQIGGAALSFVEDTRRNGEKMSLEKLFREEDHG
ncbi:hypothetical protein [Alkalicoccus chagannorensis]|nr:hypothetical protein [Alkalicoccus chagannorensis]